MKVIDSGMPKEAYWDSLFDITTIVDWLDFKSHSGSIAEIGCGYGSFTVPIAKRTMSQIHAFDIDPAMIEIAGKNVQNARLKNVNFYERDVLKVGTGLESNSTGMVLLFNILHFKEKKILLQEASRILRHSGVVAIIHWRKDIPTPRGPSVDMRPDQEDVLDSVTGLDLHFQGKSSILAPYHWGIQLIKGI